MTFLELAQELRQEAGISGSDGTPVAVTDQTGEMKRVVDWILRADAYVQRRYEVWDFLRATFSFQTIVGTTIDDSIYQLTAINLEVLNRWKLDSLRCYKTATGKNDELFLEFVPYDDFRDLYMFSANRNVRGRPYRFTVLPDKSIGLWPTADDLYTIEGEYWRKPVVMVANGDSPPYPDQFHEILIWRGLMLYGAFEAAPEVYAHGETEFNRLWSQLEADQGPQIATAGALA